MYLLSNGGANERWSVASTAVVMVFGMLCYIPYIGCGHTTWYCVSGWRLHPDVADLGLDV